MPSFKSKDWEPYLYDISVNVNTGGRMIELKDAQIQGLMIEKDYEADNLPVFMLDLSLADSSKLTVTSDMEFIIKIYKYIGPKNKKDKSKKKKSLYLSDTFCPIVTNKTPQSYSLADKVNKSDNTKKDEVNPKDLGKQTTFTLFRKADLVASKKNFNYVIKTGTMTQIVTMLLSNAGVSKVLMTNFDNTKEYNEVVLLPTTLIAQLNYLRTYFGWHKEDTLFFMDFDATYLIRMNGKCTAWRSGEAKEITFYVSAPENEDSEESVGMITQGKMIYANVSSEQYSVVDGGTVADQTAGTNVTLVNENTAGTSTVSSNSNSTIGASGTTTFKTTTGHNEYLEGQLACRKAEVSSMVKVQCSNIDISLFTPNKQYSFVAGSTKVAKVVQGTYRISKFATSFTKDGDHFSSLTDITLKKASS